MIADAENGTIRPRRRTRATQRMTYGSFLTTITTTLLFYEGNIILLMGIRQRILLTKHICGITSLYGCFVYGGYHM
jgi:hypothetical protein